MERAEGECLVLRLRFAQDDGISGEEMMREGVRRPEVDGYRHRADAGYLPKRFITSPSSCRR